VTGRPSRHPFAQGRPPVRTPLSAVRRGLDAHVIDDSGLRYVLIQGIRSELTSITRAIAFCRAFGRYEHVPIHLGAFRDWSPRIVELLTATVPAAAATGVWMGFFSLDSTQQNSTGWDVIHVYPERVLGLRAIDQHQRSCQVSVNAGLDRQRFERANLRTPA
jgi:hypothetical protein